MKTEDSLKLGERLQETLTIGAPKLSLREIAETTETTTVTLHKWSAGDVPYAFLILARLRQNYGIDLNYLLTGERSQNGDKSLSD